MTAAAQPDKKTTADKTAAELDAAAAQKEKEQVAAADTAADKAVARKLTAGQFFTTANRAAAGITAEPFDPAVKPWPVGVVDDAASPTKYSLGGGLNQPGAVVTPGDWIVTMASGERRPMSPLDFEATYSPLADAGEADSMALEKFLRRVARPVLTVGVAASGVTFRLTSIDQSEVLEGVVEGNAFVVTPAPRTTNV